MSCVFHRVFVFVLLLGSTTVDQYLSSFAVYVVMGKILFKSI